MNSDTELIRNVVLDQFRVHSMKVIALVKRVKYNSPEKGKDLR